MNCPVCKTDSLIDRTLESGLLALHCQSCGGNWIKSFQYWIWKEKQGDNLPETPPKEGLVLPVDDSKAGKMCPECSRFLTRYKVGHGIDFQLDRCNTCCGTWLDQNEWEILKSRNLHDDIHFIFSSPWQTQISKEEHKNNIDQLLKNKIGEQEFHKVQETINWLKNHTHKNEILASLTKEMK